MSKKKILILTQPLFTNYGGLLQAFALQKVLKDMGHDVVTDKRLRTYDKPPFLTFRLPRILVRSILGGVFRIKRFLPTIVRYMNENDYKILAQHTERFIEENISYTFVTDYTGNILPEANLTKYDAFVVGSDQVWRRLYSNINTYFLSFIQGNDAIKISYAASFGKDDIEEYSEEEVKLGKSLAPQFNAISVREDSGIAICKEKFGVDATHHLDPTLLLDAADYMQVVARDNIAEKKKSLMAYVLDKAEDKNRMIRKVEGKLNLTANYVMPQAYENKKRRNLEQCVYPPVTAWLSGFHDADFVITDSFHGTVFSIIFNKPFVAIVNEDRGASRFVSLLQLFGLEDRLVYTEEDLTDELIEKPIDFGQVNEVRKLKKEESFAYFEKYLS